MLERHSQPQLNQPQLNQPQLNQPQLNQPQLNQPQLSQAQLPTSVNPATNARSTAPGNYPPANATYAKQSSSSSTPANLEISRELHRSSAKTERVAHQFLSPFQRKMLLKSLQEESRSEYRRRIEIMLLADQGQSQTQICQALGCSAETARYWMTLLQIGQAHLWTDRPVGRPKTVSNQYLERLRELASHSPRDYGYPFQSWTAQWLSKHLAKEFSIEISDRHISRLLKQMDLSIQRKRSSSNSPNPDQIRSQTDPKIVIDNLHDSAPAEFSELWQFRHLS